MQLKVILDLKLFKFLFWSFKTVLTAEGTVLNFKHAWEEKMIEANDIYHICSF